MPWGVDVGRQKRDEVLYIARDATSEPGVGEQLMSHMMQHVCMSLDGDLTGKPREIHLWCGSCLSASQTLLGGKWRRTRDGPLPETDPWCCMRAGATPGRRA